MKISRPQLGMTQIIGYNLKFLLQWKQKMSRYCKGLAGFIRKMDIFPSSEFLRYKGEPYYQTITGGCASFLVLVAFIILFFSSGLKTINKQIIFASQSVEKQFNPALAQLNFTIEEGFMFAVGVQHVNLNDPNTTFFEVEIVHTFFGSDFNIIQTPLTLVPCTEEHFSFTEDTKQVFNDFKGGYWMCPPMNQSFQLQGRLFSPANQFVNIKVKKCNQSLHSNCANEATLDATRARLGGQFKVLMMILANTINPENDQYKQPSLETRNEFTFNTDTRAVEGDCFIEQSIVLTDESIWPLSDIKEEKVLSVQDFVISRPVDVADDTYVNIKMQKSPVKRRYLRSFNKVDGFLSYVGGIIGTIIGFLYIMHIYSRYSISISIGSKLFLSEEGEAISSTAFHIGYLLLIPFRRLLSYLNCCSDSWKRTQFYTRCMDEADQQIDILVIMKKIMFFQKALSLLFTNHQLEALHLFEKQRIDQVQERRKKYDLEHKFTGAILNEDQDGTPSPFCLKQSSFKKNQVVPFDAQLQSGEFSNHSVSKLELESEKRLKTQILKLMKESTEGNNMSNQIVENLNPFVLARMGLKSSHKLENSSQISESDLKKKEAVEEMKEPKPPLPPLKRRFFKKQGSKVSFEARRRSSQEESKCQQQ